MKLSKDEKGFRSEASKPFRKSEAFSKSLEKTKFFLKKEFIVGFFIGIGIYIFIFGIRVMKILIKANWNIEVVQRGLYKTFSGPGFVFTQLGILVLFVVGSVTLYSLYKGSYFLGK